MSFENWFKELTSDELWSEQASMQYKPETFKDVALKIYTNGMTDSLEFAQTPLKFHRQHVFNKLCKITPDKVRKPWYLPKEEPKPVSVEDQPLKRGSPEYIQRLNEWQEQINKAPMMQPVPKPSSREIIENGQWRPKPPTIQEPSEEEKLMAAQNYARKMRTARTKLFREKYPDGTVKQLREYLKKWSHFDNPNNVTF